MKKFLMAFLVIAMFSSSAMAGFLIEPYLGLRLSGEVDETGGNADIDTYEFSGLGYGARLGYSYLGFMMGAEYDISSNEIEQKTDPGNTPSNVGEKADADFTNIGAFVGYNFPMMFRAWFTYYFSAGMEVEGGSDKTELSAGGSNASEYKGSGYSIGVGYTGFPFISINLQYRKMTYDEVTIGSTELNLPVNNHGTYGSRGENSTSEYFIGISAPFDI